MAKKYKSTKLLKQSVASTQQPGSAFGKFANRLADAKKKKIQKLTDTQKRVLQSKKNNKMIKISKKAKKFALLDEEDQQGNGALGLTHKGVNVKDLKVYDDVDFNESDLENDEQNENFHDKINFAGFEATDNLLEEPKASNADNGKPKTQTQIYKQIIEKSKAYKMVRQQQYEQNFNMATQLDQGFDQLRSQLKFRNKDQQLLQRLQHRDLEYDKLMNELKDDERVVSNKIVEKNEKYTEKIRKKKNEQLNKLMRDSDGEEGDIRGWVDEVDSDQEEGDRQDDEESGDEEGSEQGEEQNEDGEEGQQQQGSYDELDDVDLSSEEEELEGENENEGDEEDEDQDEEEQVEGQDEGEQQQQQEADGQLDGEDEEDQDDDQQEDDEDDQQDDEDNSDESQEVELPPPSKNTHKNANKNTKQPQLQQNNSKNNASNSKQPLARQNPQKKVKLNFIQ